MTSSSHLASASLCYLLASAFLESSVSVAGVVATGIGSLLPDVDNINSNVGRAFRPLSHRIARRFGHHTLTHSLMGVLLFCGLAQVGVMVLEGSAPWREAAWCLCLGYASHGPVR